VTEDSTNSQRRTCGSLVLMRSAVRSLRFQRMEDDALRRWAAGGSGAESVKQIQIYRCMNQTIDPIRTYCEVMLCAFVMNLNIR
jgi:hypothetical protein